MTTMHLLSVATVFFQLLSTVHGACPPEGFDAKPDVDLDSFISARWYSIKQKEVFYQPLDDFYCVYADYGPDNSFCLFCGDAPRITVFNRSLKGGVDGSENSINFRAVFPRAADNAGKGFVGPTFLPYGPILLLGSSNYWIIDAGTDGDAGSGKSASSNKYDWAIITAGPIDEAGSEGKCAAGGGMWIFHRNPTPDPKVIKAIEKRADEYGIDTNQWLPVEQDGCEY